MTENERKVDLAEERRRVRESNLVAARDFRERMAQAWRDVDWPEDAKRGRPITS